MANPDSVSTTKYFLRTPFINSSFEYDTIKKRNLLNKKDSIYVNIQRNAEKNYVTRKIYGLFFRKQNLEAAGRIYSKVNATDKFMGFSSKKISSIEFIGLNAFGQSVYDSTITSTSWLESSANRLHVKTAKFLIKNNLLFKEGDLLNPVDLAESEQLLRSKDFIEDANIVVENADDTSLVNIKVITKDAWSIGVGMKLNSRYSSQYQIYDKNLGGLGIWLNGTIYNNTQIPNRWGRKGELVITNLGGTFVDIDTWFRTGQGHRTTSVDFERDFYASKAHYGGGAGLINSCEPYSFKSFDSTGQVCYKQYDYWLGRSFRVSRLDISKAPHKMVLAVRYISKYFSDRPIVSGSRNYLFHNKEYYLVGLSLTKQDLFRANLIYSLGSTEDIPTGYRVHFTTGVEKGEYENRYYVGTEFSAAELSPYGYIFSSARMGGFIAALNQIQQVTANLRTTYFSNLFSFRNIELRQFVKVDYTRGVSRFYGEGELIFLDDGNGIRGLNSKDMNGTSRLVANLETVAFSPLYLYGFRFAFYGFADFGVIGSSQDYIVGNQSFSGFGLGVRIRNENLVFNAISIRLGYYPKLPSNADVAYWLVTGQQRTRFENFRPNKPQIVPFE